MKPVLLLNIVVIILTGCHQIDADSADKSLLLYVKRYPGLGSEPMQSGLVIVLYSDRRVQRLVDRSNLSSGYIEGHLSEPDWKTIKEILDRLQRATREGQYRKTLLDAPSEDLYWMQGQKWIARESIGRGVPQSILAEFIEALYKMELPDSRAPQSMPTELP